MSYTVKVESDYHDKVKEETFESDSKMSTDLDKVEDKARKAFAAAISKYDSLHTVKLFRDNTALDGKLGTGTTSLESATPSTNKAS